MTTRPPNGSTTSRESTERPSLRARLTPLLAALGLVPMDAPLPELSGWRQVQRRTA
ncbi:MAG TPA: hypothetical protein VHG28_22490 [Longimicrobiaceae bacterium]|nr:hypothetical protein [Longimicrobiaceae bacterium]